MLKQVLAMLPYYVFIEENGLVNRAPTPMDAPPGAYTSCKKMALTPSNSGPCDAHSLRGEKNAAAM